MIGQEASILKQIQQIAYQQQCSCLSKLIKKFGFCTSCESKFVDQNKTLKEIANDQLQINSKKNNEQNLSQIDFQNETDQEANQKLIKQIMINIFTNSSICNSTQRLYEPVIKKFIMFVNPQVKEDLTPNQILQFLHSQCKISITTFNALSHMCSELLINFNQPEKKQYQKLKHRTVHSQQPHPHRYWKLELIQKFLDDLCKIENFVIAFRIYILYYLGARISELSQITYNMILNNGWIQYVPLKQKKRGLNCQRNFKLNQDVIHATEKFIQLGQINQEQNLDIGQSKRKLKQHSLQIDLKRAKLKIRKQIKKDLNEYDKFLQLFSYHDLRYTRLKSMQQQGYQKEVIQQFVKHKTIMQTQHYLKINHNNLIDFNKIQETSQENEDPFLCELILKLSQPF